MRERRNVRYRISVEMIYEYDTTTQEWCRVDASANSQYKYFPKTQERTERIRIFKAESEARPSLIALAKLAEPEPVCVPVP
jgi:hypothetical protein